ncbi:MAG: esterase [Gammaproteobacteria bacterium RIFCSPHIGHO2_12_FULL_35_23]|nr:MAG: esterase [Gammaproteobacteria bacterium RIFCSPHIGHO2_12_FULL_35_23]
MRLWKSPISLELIKARSKNTLVEFLNIEFIEIGDDYLTAKMLINQRAHQPMGIMHGGVSCMLAETVASFAANYVVDTTKQYCVGLEINTNHIRSVRSGYVLATAKPFHLGRSTQVWGIEIKDKAEHLISVNRLTLAVLDKKR